MSRKQATPWGTRKIYEFIAAHRKSHDIKTMCGADLPDFLVPRVIGKQLPWGFVLITVA